MDWNKNNYCLKCDRLMRPSNKLADGATVKHRSNVFGDYCALNAILDWGCAKKTWKLSHCV